MAAEEGKDISAIEAGVTPGELAQRRIGYSISGVDELWDLIKEGTKRFNSARSAFVVVGPDLGNLGGQPQLRFIDNHLTLKLDISKYGGSGFYEAIPEEILAEKLAQVFPDLEVDGISIYKRTKEGPRIRIAFKNTDGKFEYSPEAPVASSQELRDHLELAVQIYREYATAYYEKNELRVPGDTIVIRPEELKRAENVYSSGKTQGAESGFLEAMLISKKPDVTFKDIGGQERAVATCRRFAEQLRYPEVFALEGSEPPRGILLYGPPGTGKTLLAKAIANVADAHFMHIEASDLVGEGLYGQAEQGVTGIFSEAGRLANETNRHVVVFVDEGDLLLPAKGIEGAGYRHEATAKVIGIFAQGMDGVVSTRKITVIISTNEPKDLDPRILSRMDEMEEVPLPDKNGLKSILKIHLSKLEGRAHRELVDKDIDIAQLADRAFEQKLSGRDVADVLGILARQRGQAQLLSLKQAIEAGKLTVPIGSDEASYIKGLAGQIARGEIQGLERFVIPPIRTEDIYKVIDSAKALLKKKKVAALGFKVNE